MKLFKLFTFERKSKRKTLAEVETEAASQYAREQFQKLIKKGIRIPIVLL